MTSIVERRRVVISDDNLGPVVSIVSIFLLILVLLTVLTRLSTRYFLRKQLSLEDGLVFLAAVWSSQYGFCTYSDCLAQIFSIGELVTVLGLDGNGLGKPIQTLSTDKSNRFQQYSYATDVLYVLNLGLTEISVLLLIYNITPVRGQQVAVLIVLGFTALWTISSVIALLLQCHVPQTWQFINHQCINRVSRSRRKELRRTLINPSDCFLGLLYRCSRHH